MRARGFSVSTQIFPSHLSASFRVDSEFSESHFRAERRSGAGSRAGLGGAGRERRRAAAAAVSPAADEGLGREDVLCDTVGDWTCDTVQQGTRLDTAPGLAVSW